MATYEGLALAPPAGDRQAWALPVEATYTGAAQAAAAAGPDYTTGTYAVLGPPASGPVQAFSDDFSGRLFQDRTLQPTVATFAAWLLDLTGKQYAAVALRVSAVYRQGDKLTLAGYALDLAGNPLRQFQLQFIGETVQENTAGFGTNLDGVYAAYLTVGDTYLVYAFHPATGVVFKLDHEEEPTPGQTNLRFRQVTRRVAGDGVFLRAGAA